MSARVSRCVVLGAGGHARVLLDILLARDAIEIVALLDADSSLWGGSVCGVPVVGDDDRLESLTCRGADSFVVGLGGTGDNRPRQKLFEMGVAHGLQPLSVVHSSAQCSRLARIGDGCQLLPGSVVNAGALLGKNVLVNTGGIIEHDCVVGDHVHVATGATLSGGVRLHDRVHVGSGAVVRQGITIGEGAVVGAGAVVVKDIAPGLIVVGVPARPFPHHS